MINLLNIWKKDNKANDVKYQNTFVFTQNPKCTFVKNNNLEEIYNLKDIDNIKLTNEETIKANQELQKIKLAGDYDGDLFFLKTLIYDTKTNKLYIGLVKTKYSVLRTFDRAKKEKYGLYKTGIIAPTVTSDNKIVLFERKRDHFYSPVCGFMEQKHGQREIGDLIKQTVLEENKEELYGDDIDLNSNEWQYNLKAISYTKNRSGVEFISTLHNKNINSKKFVSIFKNSKAMDRKEHTDKFLTVNLNNKNEIKNILNDKQYTGKFLHGPVVLSNTDTVQCYNINHKLGDELDKCIDGLNTFTDKQFVDKVETVFVKDISPEQQSKIMEYIKAIKKFIF